MKTYLECFSCFMNQALSISRKAGLDEEGQRDVMNRVSLMLPEFEMSTTPPEMARRIIGMIQSLTGVEDPFFEEKRISNQKALELAERIEEKIARSDDPLLTSIEYAIAGNSIDFGAYHDLDIEKTIVEKVTEENSHIKNEEPRLFAYNSFREKLKSSNTLLYIADNAGEFVFDFILLKNIKRLYPEIEITVAVRSGPALNDVTLEDARQIGMDREFTVLPSGSDAPGTLLDYCSAEFLDLLYGSDLVVSKGQGNYETLSGIDRRVFFLLRTKCVVIARHTGSNKGDILLM
ncbi:MAG: damage-control phosphatase ARMT1 family protein, partial [Spirochaetaceae bacterium]